MSGEEENAIIGLFVAGHHYRHIWQYDAVELASAVRFAATLHTAVTQPAQSRSLSPLDPSSRRQAFLDAMLHDLDTPEAMKILEIFAQEILQAIHHSRPVQAAQQTLRSMSRMLGLRLDKAALDPAVHAGWSRHLQLTRTDVSGF